VFREELIEDSFTATVIAVPFDPDAVNGKT
jgi:hypothetical protein